MRFMLSSERQETDASNHKTSVEETTEKDYKRTFWILMLGAIPIIFIQTAIRTALPTMLEDLSALQLSVSGSLQGIT